MIELKWISDRIPDDRAGVEEKIRKELTDLDCDPFQLYFHTVFLDNMDGPCISITPSDDKT